jgi:hypothetical protein
VLLIEIIDVYPNFIVIALNDIEWQVFELLFDERVIDGTTKKSLETVNRVFHVCDHLILSGHADYAISGAEGHA